MQFLNKVGFILHGFIIGYLFVYYMISPIYIESKVLILFTCILYFGLHRFRKKLDKKIFGKLILIGILIGYCINTFLTYRDHIKVEYPFDYEEEKSKEKANVIMVLPSYPKTYNPKEWSHIIKYSQDYSNISKKIFLPFILNKYKRIYKMIGVDPSKDNAMEFAEKIKYNLDSQKNNLYISYINETPVLEEQIIKALQRAPQNIHIINLLLDQSDDWFMIQERIEGLRYYNYEINISYGDPFWTSKGLKKMFRDKIMNASKEYNKKNTGVLFVGTDSRNSSDNNFQEAYNQQISFAKEVKESLLVEGYNNNKIQIAFLNNKKYSIKEVLMELLNQNIAELVVAPIHIPFDNLDSIQIIPEEIRNVSMPSSIKVRYIAAWNSHPYFIEEVLKRIEETNENFK